MTWEGILPVWKPEGFTSHDVVAKARRLLGEKRIGHTGTLDPQVTGVLPLCVGRATRMVEYIQELPKEYEAHLLIGVSTDTEDMTGTVLEEVAEVVLTDAQVREVIASFVGDISQVPPMYSAVKVEGKRLYELAREGKDVERKARTVTIYEIDILHIDVTAKHPEVRFRVRCSKGTYIRTLCVDIGKALGYPAAMKQLVRTSTGHIRAEQCVTFAEIERLKAAGELEQKFIPMDQVVGHLPAVHLSEAQSLHALQGKKISPNPRVLGDIAQANGALFRAYSPEERFLGLFEWNVEGQHLTPVKVFL